MLRYTDLPPDAGSTGMCRTPARAWCRLVNLHRANTAVFWLGYWTNIGYGRLTPTGSRTL